ncbi:MAG: hypothetical protein FWH23_07670 [Bacteroidales bacterium]|nr:hypothetical protein [Bacteroidales bacterium]MCL2133376.1 hypothetical protein [Bacteroidales bacterium]
MQKFEVKYLFPKKWLGLIFITECLYYRKPPIKAIEAGADILCLSNNGKTYDGRIATKAVNIIFRAVKQGKITPERIE